MIKFEMGDVFQDDKDSPAYAFVSVDFGRPVEGKVGPRIAVIGDTTLEAMELRDHVLDKLNA